MELVLYRLVLHGGETYMVSDLEQLAEIMQDENALQLMEDERNAVFDVPKAIQAIKTLKPGSTWRSSLGYVTCDEVELKWLPRGEE